MENDDSVMILVSLILSITSITMLAACLCCRKKVRNNELLGLEGMVKIKNPDENLLNGNHSIAIVESETKLSINDITDSKRSLNVPHRSLPDIPISDPNQLDTNSDLYATVGDKVGDKPQGQSPTSGAKKQISISQHSSISQADDFSSPYARVRSPLHAYDKVRQTEHPYAQVKAIGDATNQPSTSNATISSSHLNNNNSENSNNSNEERPLSRRSSHESLLLDSVDGRQHQVIPAASAIAGRVSASQELPYMTPPIVQPQQYFSGDSQDSSKGYTSISVREPLANIIAQTKQQNAQSRRREISDSHYATVSDDSDEMYAAIEDPNNPAELLYTSGSETYAQIQPQEPLVVSVEINPLPNSSTTSTSPPLSQPIPPLASYPAATQSNSLTATTPRNSVIESAIDMLKTSAHSRQASSSSCTSSVGNLGSPKPEKRQANSPLPPTPKSTQQYQSNNSLANSVALQSGRNSVASVIDTNAMTANQRNVSRENLSSSMDGRNMPRPSFNDRLLAADDEPKKNRLSKDLEGMYAKVMKKNKLSNAPSVNTSPVPFRRTLNDPQRQSVFRSDPDIAIETSPSEPLSKSMNAASAIQSIKSAQLIATNEYETIDKRKVRNSSSNYDSKNDPGYETIPADQPNSSKTTDKTKRNNFSRQSAPPGMFLQKLSQSSLNTFIEPASETFAGNYGGDGSEPGYESLPDQPLSLSNDPGYETLEKSNPKNSKKNDSDYDPNYETLRPTESVDHYAKVLNKLKSDTNDGYSSIKTVKKKIVNDDDENLGYCTISEDSPSTNAEPLNHDYASICETTKELEKTDEEFYSSIISHEAESPHSILQIETKQNGPSIASTPSSITLSPNTAFSASICSTVSDSKTLTTTSSSEGDDSTSNMPIAYNSLRSTDRSQLTISVSNYESLTGSESDSNYESIRYLNANSTENPYEQLYNESDIKYDTLKRDNTSGSIAGIYASKFNESNNSSPSSTSASINDGRTGRNDGKMTTSNSFNLN